VSKAYPATPWNLAISPAAGLPWCLRVESRSCGGVLSIPSFNGPNGAAAGRHAAEGIGDSVAHCWLPLYDLYLPAPVTTDRQWSRAQLSHISRSYGSGDTEVAPPTISSYRGIRYRTWPGEMGLSDSKSRR